MESDILTDGKARKIHYTCDLYFALNWGLITGFSSTTVSKVLIIALIGVVVQPRV